MSISQDQAHQAIITTDAGDVLAIVQNHRTVLVKAGEQYSPGDPAPADPLDLGRGVLVSIHAHFKLTSDPSCAADWKPWTPTIRRVDQHRHKETTRAQDSRAINAIALALSRWDELPELLAAAGRDASQQEAAKRLEMAGALGRAAKLLEDEARELLQGGRVSHRIQRREGHGADERVTVVRRADGTLTDPIPTLPVLYGASDQRGRIISDREQD